MKTFTPDEIDDRISELCKIRDRLRPMLEDTYTGSYAMLKPIPGSSSHYHSKQRKTTLKEARARIARSVEELNRVINAIDELRKP
jgi:hypothetical protein